MIDRQQRVRNDENEPFLATFKATYPSNKKGERKKVTMATTAETNSCIPSLQSWSHHNGGRRPVF